MERSEGTGQTLYFILQKFDMFGSTFHKGGKSTSKMWSHSVVVNTPDFDCF